MVKVCTKVTSAHFHSKRKICQCPITTLPNFVAVGDCCTLEVTTRRNITSGDSFVFADCYNLFAFALRAVVTGFIVHFVAPCFC
jgi:hypothetical protein